MTDNQTEKFYRRQNVVGCSRAPKKSLRILRLGRDLGGGGRTRVKKRGQTRGGGTVENGVTAWGKRNLRRLDSPKNWTAWDIPDARLFRQRSCLPLKSRPVQDFNSGCMLGTRALLQTRAVLFLGGYKQGTVWKIPPAGIARGQGGEKRRPEGRVSSCE